jgi:hypothetical protein
MTTVEDAEYKKHAWALGDNMLNDLSGLSRSSFKSLKKNLSVGFSIAQRFNGNLQPFKFLNFQKISYIVTNFKVVANNTNAIYAFLYSEIIDGNIKHSYITCSPTFLSQDGEYRNRLIPFHKFEKIYEIDAELFSPIEDMIIDKLESDELEFGANIYYPKNFDYDKKKFEDEINIQRFAIKAYTVCWFRDFHTIYKKSMENHINPAYQSIIYQDYGLPVHKKLADKLTEVEYINIYYNYEYIEEENENSPSQQIAMGHKLFPITIAETNSLYDTRYNVWREIDISSRCTNLVLNLITPGFPVYNTWFYVQNTNSTIFDNIVQLKKYNNSKIAEEINVHLTAANSRTKKETEVITTHLTNKFKMLSYNIGKPIKYTEENLILSDITLGTITEHVDRTLKDIIPATENQSLHAYNLMFLNVDYVFKILFDYYYSAFCMHTKLNVIHTDIHSNNITIHRLFNPGKFNNVKNTRCLYILKDSAYMLEHYGHFGVIIDFSRAVLNNRDELLAKYGEAYTIEYYKQQRRFMLFTLDRYFHTMVEHHNSALWDLAINNFDLLFKVTSIIDFYSIINNLIMLYTDDIKNSPRLLMTLNPEILPKLKEIAKYIDGLMTVLLFDMINKKITTPDQIEWPGETIIRHVFKEYLFDINTKTPPVGMVPDVTKTPKIHIDELNKIMPACVMDKTKVTMDDIMLCDVFNYNNEIQYTFDTLETCPPFIRTDEVLELRKKYNRPVDNIAIPAADHRDNLEEAEVQILADSYKTSSLLDNVGEHLIYD